ncbi:MAG: glycoside hydrolase family 2 protein [Devosia sp.]
MPKPGLPDAISATVPGTIHTDLLANGLIPDPYLDLNEIAVDWVGRSDWIYTLDFELPSRSRQHIDLVAEGLDTFAEIELNGARLGATRNMNRTYRFAVRDHLVEGRNQLRVTFRSAWDAGAEEAKRYEPRPTNYPGPANVIRKMACNFGWDWGPTLVTAGIWKSIYLESYDGGRLATVRPEVTIDGGHGHVQVHTEIDGIGALVRAEIAGVVVTAPPGEPLKLVVRNPKLWWPHNLGAQPLYDLVVTLEDEVGTTLDRWHRRVGFRSVRLDTKPDDIGSAFTFVINEVPVYVFGANWIPDDCFLPRVTRERYRTRVAQAREANINMLRVWGGGIYETDDFYEACDEAGVMVWQDFLFACAAYPEEGDLPAEIEAEARQNVVRLMPHPSLVVWNGNNENIWGFVDWGWKPVLGNKSWGLGYYLDLLPRVVAELDPTRPYWPGSPYSGSMDIHPNADEHGCKHIWNVWNQAGYEVYRNYVPRFCSEFGWQAPSTFATIQQSMHDDPLTPTSPAVAHHQKATEGNQKLLNGLAGHLPQPTNFDDWLFLTQLNQARAVQFAIEHFRSHRGVNMGAIVWQLNDCWPVTSWAAIDGYGRKKPMWHALRSAYAPHLLTLQPRDGAVRLLVVNDLSLFWRQALTVRRMNFAGEVLAQYDLWRVLADRFTLETVDLPADITTAGDSVREFVVATMGACTALHFFNEDIALDLPMAEFSVSVSGEGDHYAVDVTAKTFLRDLCLFADRLHPAAEVDRMAVNVLPGDTVRFIVHSPIAITADMLGKPVLRCVNDIPKG